MSSTVIPCLQFRDAPAAIAWLGEAFGFECRARHDLPDGGGVAHAELVAGDGMIMLGSLPPDGTEGRVHIEPGTACLYVIVEDVDAHHARAVAAGARIDRAPADTDYGSREYHARDPEGNLYSFGDYDPWSAA